MLRYSIIYIKENPNGGDKLRKLWRLNFNYFAELKPSLDFKKKKEQFQLVKDLVVMIFYPWKSKY